jgi:hypothetical protein
MRCFSCQTELCYTERPTRRETCAHCGHDVHVCRNCHHYDTSAYNECREPSAERVLDKEKSNFCDHFVVASHSSVPKEGASKAMEALEALFKK